MMESQLRTSESDNVSAERKRTQQEVFSDYLELVKNAVQENWMLEGNKSVDYGKIEQSQLQHMNNGATVLFNLFTSLPEDHFFVDEEMLRQCVALYFAHDYHKLRDSDWGEEFEISLTEAEAFIETFNLETLWEECDEFAVRAIMASHHMSSDKAKKNEVPIEYLDSLYIVMLADTLASKPSLSGIGSNAQSSVSNALSEDDQQYTVKKHTLKRSLGETSMTLNKAVADCLSEYGFIPLRIYEDGCLYAAPISSEIDDDELNQKVFEKFREYIREAHPSYSLEAVESSNINLVDTKSRYYEVGYNDVLFRGLEDSIRGVVKQAVADSRKMDEATPSMKRSVRDINDILDFDFHTETRRVEGLSDGIHTIYRQFTDALVDTTLDSEEIPKWKTNRAFATLKLFGLYEDEEARETLEILKDWGEKKLEAGPHWDYKYPLGQLVFEKYCTGLSQNELTEKLSEVVLDNLKDFENYEEIEASFIDGIKSELASYIGINVEIDGKNLSRYRESTADVKAYTTNPDKQDCAVCDWGTTADKYDNRLLSDESTVEIDINVTGTGEHETVQTTDNEAFCFMCQLEFSLREELTEEWGDEDIIYAEFEPEYSYIPLSWWTANNFLSGLEDYNTGNLTIDSIAEEILQGDVPKPMERLLDWETTSQLESLIELESGYSPYVPYGGRRIPIGTMEEESEVFEAVSAIVATAVYSGVRVSISTKAMSTVEYNTDSLISVEPSIADKFPFEFEENTLSLSESEDLLRTVCVMTELYETIEADTSTSGSPFKSKPKLFSHLSSATSHPGSRAAVMARNRGLDVSEYGAEIREIDEMFGSGKYDGLLEELTLYITELDKTTEAKSNKQFVEETLAKISKGEISERNTQMWAENKAKERSGLDENFTERVAGRYAECIDELCGKVSMNSERLINLQHEVGDVIEMRTYERRSSFNNGEN